MSKKLTYILGLAMTLFLLVGGTAFAATNLVAQSSSSNPKPHGAHALMVTLDSVSGTTLTVTTRGKNASITTIDASNAKIFLKGVSSDVTNLQAGDRLIVIGTPSGTSSFTAERINDGAGAPKTPDVISGTVTAVSGSSITVSVKQHVHSSSGNTVTTANVTVTTDSTTTFSVPGTKSATIADVTVGSRVLVIGVDPTTGSGTAHLVSVMPAMRSVKKTS